MNNSFELQQTDKFSMYQFYDVPDGFFVSRKKAKVFITQREGVVKIIPIFVYGTRGERERALVELRSIVLDTVGILLDEVGGHIRNDTKNLFSGDKFTVHELSKWCVVRAAKSIARRFYSHFDKLITDHDRELLAIQKKIYALQGRIDVEIAQGISFIVRNYDIPWAGDVIKYRAAAAVLWAWAKVGGKKPPPDFLADWKSCFSCQARPYTSLNKTLMNLPGMIPVKFLKNLRLVRLQRPIKDRVELILLLGFLNRQPVNLVNLPVVMHATREEILRAHHFWTDGYLEEMNQRGPQNYRQVACQRQLLRPTNSFNILRLADYIADYPHKFNGRILGLLKKAGKWHSEEEQKKLIGEFNEVGMDKTLDVQRIDHLPEGFTQIATVSQLWAEGEKMQHCIRSYLHQAFSGWIFLFHVEKDEEEATLLIGSDQKRVVYGPHNRENRACMYARSVTLEIPEEMQLDDDIPF